MPTPELHNLIAVLESCAAYSLDEADRHRLRSDDLRGAAGALRDGDKTAIFETLLDLEEPCWSDEHGSELSQAINGCYEEVSHAPMTNGIDRREGWQHPTTPLFAKRRRSRTPMLTAGVGQIR